MFKAKVVADMIGRVIVGLVIGTMASLTVYLLAVPPGVTFSELSNAGQIRIFLASGLAGGLTATITLMNMEILRKLDQKKHGS